MSKTTLETIIEERLKEVLAKGKENIHIDSSNITKAKLTITVTDKTTYIEGEGNQTILLNAINGLCKALEKRHNTSLHEIFLAIEYQREGKR